MATKAFLGYFYMLDMFSQSISFRTSRENETMRSTAGSLLSIIVLVLTIPYTVEKFIVFRDRQSQSIITETKEDYFDPTEYELTVGESNN